MNVRNIKSFVDKNLKNTRKEKRYRMVGLVLIIRIQQVYGEDRNRGEYMVHNDKLQPI